MAAALPKPIQEQEPGKFVPGPPPEPGVMALPGAVVLGGPSMIGLPGGKKLVKQDV